MTEHSAEFDQILNKSVAVASLMGQISHPVRLQVLCCLAQGEKSVGELAQFCQLSQPNTSQFLARMKKGGVIESRRNGQIVLYRIKDQRVIQLLAQIKTLFC